MEMPRARQLLASWITEEGIQNEGKVKRSDASCNLK